MHTVFLRIPALFGSESLTITNPYYDFNHILAVAYYLMGNDFLLYYNGKELLEEQDVPTDSNIYISASLPGGKGGFGSMLRAIGAQIEKTTNREACRDLSGRRLRDINEEQRLKKWIAKKAEREAEKIKRRRERIERLKSKPRHNFVDFDYEKEISELPERIDDALSAGMEKASKRPLESNEASSSKKKRLWLDEDISESSESDLGESSSDCLPGVSSEKDVAGTSNDFKLVEIESDSTSSSSNYDNQYLSTSSNKQETCVQNECDTETTSSTSLSNINTIEIQHSETSSNDSKLETGIEQKSLIAESSINSRQENIMMPETDKKDVIFTDTKGTGTENNIQETLSSSKKELFDAPIDLKEFASVSELEALGLERLKFALMSRGLKCGGSVKDRAQRLWAVKDLEPNQYPKNLLSKQKK